MQSAYDFAILNQWNGTNTLQDGSKIVAGMIAAGKKDSQDNTFSGIILGDMQDPPPSEGEESPPARTGLYGILKGIPTFSLTDSGNAFFDYSMNNSNEIMTSTHIHFGAGNTLSSVTDTDKYLTFDLDDQYLEFRSNRDNTKLLLSTGDVTEQSATYLHFQKNNGTIMTLGTSENYLQSSNYNDSNKTGLRINLGTKKIIGWTDAELTWQGPMIVNSNSFITINTKTADSKVF